MSSVVDLPCDLSLVVTVTVSEATRYLISSSCVDSQGSDLSTLCGRCSMYVWMVSYIRLFIICRKQTAVPSGNTQAFTSISQKICMVFIRIPRNSCTSSNILQFPRMILDTGLL